MLAADLQYDLKNHFTGLSFVLYMSHRRVKCRMAADRADIWSPFLSIDKVRPCTVTEALYRPYGL